MKAIGKETFKGWKLWDYVQYLWYTVKILVYTFKGKSLCPIDWARPHVMNMLKDKYIIKLRRKGVYLVHYVVCPW